MQPWEQRDIRDGIVRAAKERIATQLPIQIRNCLIYNCAVAGQSGWVGVLGQPEPVFDLSKMRPLRGRLIE